MRRAPLTGPSAPPWRGWGRRGTCGARSRETKWFGDWSAGHLLAHSVSPETVQPGTLVALLAAVPLQPSRRLSAPAGTSQRVPQRPLPSLAESHESLMRRQLHDHYRLQREVSSERGRHRSAAAPPACRHPAGNVGWLQRSLACAHRLSFHMKRLTRDMERHVSLVHTVMGAMPQVSKYTCRSKL